MQCGRQSPAAEGVQNAAAERQLSARRRRTWRLKVAAVHLLRALFEREARPKLLVAAGEAARHDAVQTQHLRLHAGRRRERLGGGDEAGVGAADGGSDSPGVGQAASSRRGRAAGIQLACSSGDDWRESRLEVAAHVQQQRIALQHVRTARQAQAARPDKPAAAMWQRPQQSRWV